MWEKRKEQRWDKMKDEKKVTMREPLSGRLRE
jgi:hypothetical protein